MTFLMVTFYVTVLTFLSFSSSIITALWLPTENSDQQNQEVAGQLIGTAYLCCMFVCPAIGMFIDKKG
jgi:hypothetical protein